jgi:hypothetical protein
MTIDEFLTRLKAADLHAIKTGDWADWKALQDQHLTDEMMQRMSRSQRLRLHELTHISTILADPDGSWSDQLSERLELEFRAGLEREAVHTEARTAL